MPDVMAVLAEVIGTPTATADVTAALANGARTARRFHLPELDVVRFIAFFLVFLYHVFQHGPESYERYFGHTASRFFAGLANAFGLGLCLFFFLSAYLISELLLREQTISGTISIKRFYQRRALRIWPLYFFGVAIGMAIAIAQRSIDDIRHFLAFTVFAGNWSLMGRDWSENPMTVLWSISIEEQFYIVWPLVIKFAGSAGTWFVAVLISLASVSETTRLANAGADLSVMVWYNTLVQFLMFTAGTFYALYLRGRLPSLSTASRLTIAALGAMAWLVAAIVCRSKGNGPAQPGALVPIGYVLTAVGCVLIVTSILGIKARMPRALVYLGRISFGLYVYHALALYLVGLATSKLGLHAATLKTSPIAFALTVAMAAVSYRYFEVPFLKMKNRLATVDTML
jgi:peptidoglycan/LPS O-acetylase OafA/YrhL